ncbi:hypothetical protein TNCV_619881 [Trichonephila clavipes]|nr:hypothetical protein TNCV_619881 [Trichonephila clavipes]
MKAILRLRMPLRRKVRAAETLIGVNQVPFINRIMLVHILRECLQGYDVLPWPSRSPDLSPISMSGRAGKATAAVPRYRRINCADAKTMAGSSTGGHN